MCSNVYEDVTDIYIFIKNAKISWKRNIFSLNERFHSLFIISYDMAKNNFLAEVTFNNKFHKAAKVSRFFLFLVYICSKLFPFICISFFTVLSTHFRPMFHFYTPWKRPKTRGSLTFLGGIDKKYKIFLILNTYYFQNMVPPPPQMSFK